MSIIPLEGISLRVFLMSAILPIGISIVVIIIGILTDVILAVVVAMVVIEMVVILVVAILISKAAVSVGHGSYRSCRAHQNGVFHLKGKFASLQRVCAQP